MHAESEESAMKHSTELRTWVNEAIQSLGYIKPEAASKLVKLIQDNESQHPKQISTSYRKEGEQLSGDEKKRLGIRANAMMSKQALDDLTEKGRAVPLAAHEQTILRASLAWSRSQNLESLGKAGVRMCEAIAPFADQCPGCKHLDGKILPIGDIDPLGPQDCFREACAIAFAAKLDDGFLAKERPAPPTAPRKSSKPWWRFW